jgi:hypothetical protein
VGDTLSNTTSLISFIFPKFLLVIMLRIPLRCISLTLKNKYVEVWDTTFKKLSTI